MKRFWVSFWTGNEKEEGCSKPPFKYCISDSRNFNRVCLSKKDFETSKRLSGDELEEFIYKHSRQEVSVCCVIDEKNEDAVWKEIVKYFPDFDERFCIERESDFKPSNRFQ